MLIYITWGLNNRPVGGRSLNLSPWLSIWTGRVSVGGKKYEDISVANSQDNKLFGDKRIRLILKYIKQKQSVDKVI
jgi:hypothetical protein